jgi:uncharacterized protein DUF1566/PEP-CTERM motif-containing protein
MRNRLGRAVRQCALALLLAAGMASGVANATLIAEPDGVVLDTVTGLEWEQNANHGPFNWAGAVSYATTLALDGGGFHLATIGELQGLYNDLSAANVCTGANCTGNISGFTGIQSVYWSGTEVVPGSVARVFNFVVGNQGGDVENDLVFAWAVRPGDVDAAAPEPASLLLIGVGMLGLGWSRRSGRRR